MSYKVPDTGDPELDKALRKEDYDMLLHWLLEVETAHAFACWLDKLALIDKEAVTAYVRDHWGELDAERRAWARLRLDAVRDLSVDGKEADPA